MKLKFTKMHGAGNDFIVINAMAQNVSHFGPDDWRHLADRHFGIGADQILLVETPQSPDVDFRYSIINQDGSSVENCGNGARCFVKYVHSQGLTDKTEVKVEIQTGQMILKLNEDGSVTVNMGVPKYTPEDLPAIIHGLPTKIQGEDILYNLLTDQGSHWVSLVSMGNPHAVMLVDDVNTAPVEVEGAALERHSVFPRKVNVGFLQIHDVHHVSVRVFERGSGETLACGTGACAAVVAGIRRGVLKSPVNVKARGGVLDISWEGEGAPVLMSGPAVRVFEGELDYTAGHAIEQ